MKSKGIRSLAITGILLALFLSVWYLMKTYREGNPRLIFLVLALGILTLLSQNIRRSSRRR